MPGACVGLSKIDGLPYCCRVSTAHSACQLVGSPSLIGGKNAARIGRYVYTDKPTTATSSAATANDTLPAMTAYTRAAANKMPAAAIGSQPSRPSESSSPQTVVNTTNCDHSTLRSPSDRGRFFLSGGYSRIMTTGPTNTPIM